jgi:hypothetical protein
MNGKVAPALLLICHALCCQAAFAHAVSMSTGEIVIHGAQGHYDLRMPLYEIAHTQSPERTLLDHIHFFSAGREAKLLSRNCAADPAHSLYLCSADYEFAAPVEHLEVECTYSAVTVPNHVHMLRAEMPGKSDEAVLDIGFPRATLRFRPPTPTEIAAAQIGAGGIRALAGIPQLFFLAALVVAARSRRELLALFATFCAGQMISILALPRAGWQPSPRFVEAAAALTVAYLAIEILFLPKAGARWLIAGILGAVHGLFFAGFIQNTGYSPGFVLPGVMIAQFGAIIVMALAFSRIAKLARVLRPVQVSASALLVFGISWFLLRLRS